MKISLDDLFQKNPYKTGLHLFNKLKIQDIDFDNIKEIEVYTNNNYLYLQWLCEKFNLTLTIIYDKYESIYKSGKLTHYENSKGYTEDYKYNKLGLKTHYEDSTGYTEDYKYNKLGLKTHYEDSTRYTKDYKYNKLGLKTHYEDSTGLKEDWKYNKLGLKTHYENSIGRKEDYKYNKNNELIDISIFNYNFIEDELKYEIK